MIIPAVIPQSLSDLKEKLALVSFASRVQIDVVDGKFDDDISWPYKGDAQVSEAAGLAALPKVEVDLMVENAIAAGKEWLEIGVSSLIFHIEGLSGVEEVLKLRSQYQFSVGFALGNDTSPDRLHPYIAHADFVQLMGIREIGAQGQPFDSRVLERLAALRHLYPRLALSVDGGVNEDTIYSIKQAGADRFVAGSAILKSSDPKTAYEKLLKIIA